MKNRASKTLARRSGFTLVEVMIATLIFSVGMMAVVSMEFSALRAYSSGRDLTVATDLGYRTISIMRAEAAVWSEKDKGAILSGAQDGGGGDISIKSLYTAGSPVDPGGQESLLGLITQTPWQWEPVTPNPVDARLIPGVSGRYCVYARGTTSTQAQSAAANVNGAATTVTPLIQAQIAVVYPGGTQGFASQANGNLASCATLPGCTGAAVDLLVPEGLDTTQSGIDALPPLEQCGWRGVYMGAMISRSNG